MARSNQGGTKGFLRGKVAGDLYQVTKNADGKRIQLVRAVESSRVNNNTIGQAVSRMKMAALMRALSQLKEIVDHSWESVPYGQLSIAHFVEVNMPYVNWDVYENWAMQSHFCMPQKGDDAYMIGSYQISEGTLPSPDFVTCNDVEGTNGQVKFFIGIGKANPTMGDLKRRMGLMADDYITILLQAGSPQVQEGIPNAVLWYKRLYVNKAIPDSTVITSSNAGDMFTYGGNCEHSMMYNPYIGQFTLYMKIDPGKHYRQGYAYAVIASRWDGAKWCRNNAWFMDQYGFVSWEWGNGASHIAFASWYPDWSPDDGCPGHPWDKYPSSKPENMKALE